MGVWLLAPDFGDVPLVDGSERQRLCARADARHGSPGPILWSVPLALGRDRLLKLRIGDLEAVLGGQLHAGAHELPVAVDGDCSPLLGA